MGLQPVFQGVQETHDTVFSLLDLLPEAGWSSPAARDAVLHLFLVDSEVLRNLAELYTGENPDPEMLAREDHAAWFQKSHERTGHWGLLEALESASRLAPLFPPASG